MGNGACQALGIDGEAPVSVKDSCEGMMRVFAKATKKEHGGKLVVYTGEISGW